MVSRVYFDPVLFFLSLSLIHRNAKQHKKGDCITISGKTQDPWSQQYFISKYVNS